MATLSEHAENIKAAIQAALDDGYEINSDVSLDWDGLVETVELDLWDKGTYVNVFTEEF